MRVCFRFLLLLLLAARLSAGGSHVHFAITGNQIEGGEYRPGGAIGVDMIKTFDSGIEAGAALESGVFLVDAYESLNDDAGVVVDLLFRIGYDFDALSEMPLAIRGGIGYGLGQIGGDTMQGSVHDIAAEYELDEKYGVGFRYKSADFTLTHPDDPGLDYTQLGLYLSVKY